MRNNWVAYQDIEPPKLKAILRKGPKLRNPSCFCKKTQGTLHFVKIVIQPTRPHERSSYAQKFEDRFQEETLNRSDVPAEMRRLPISEHKLNNKHKSNILLAFGCLVSSSAILNKTRGRRSVCRFRSINAHAEHERPEFG